MSNTSCTPGVVQERTAQNSTQLLLALLLTPRHLVCSALASGKKAKKTAAAMDSKQPALKKAATKKTDVLCFTALASALSCTCSAGCGLHQYHNSVEGSKTAHYMLIMKHACFLCKLATGMAQWSSML
jgi:hypothetical protein